MNYPIVRCQKLGKSFATRTEDGQPTTLNILQDIDFSLEAGTFAAIVGASGCGKSTLLNILGLLDRPTEGTLEIDGQAITSAARSQAEYCQLRNEKFGFVFQNHNLLPEMTAIENIMVPLLIQGRTARVARRRADELLAELFSPPELDSGVGHRPPARMSGGQCQRVAIARALSAGPALVLADEPTGNLDEKTGAQVFDLLRELQRKHALSVVMVTHNPAHAQAVDRVIRLSGGRLVES